jgi:hypothetical protein
MIGFESTYGTAPSAGYTLPFNSCDVVGTKARNTPATLTGTRNPVVPFAGNQDVSGNIVVPADSDAMAYWLAAMFGDPISNGADPYVHEYKIASTMPSITIEKAFTDIASNVYERFVGCKISTMSITIGGDGELVVSMGVLGKQMTEETSAFDAAPTSVSIDRVDNFSAAMTEGGGALSNAREVTLDIDFGLDADQFVIGASGTRGDIPEGIVAVSGNLMTLFEDKTLLDKAINDTESSLKVTVTQSANSVLEFEVQELLYSVNGIPVDGPQGLMVNLDFQGYYTDGSEASALVARVTNNVSSYDVVP